MIDTILECPNCDKTRPIKLLPNHVVQARIKCNKCGKFWIYKIDIAKRVKDRIVMWHYSNSQD